MTSAHDHILADMAYLFAQDGEEVVDLLLDNVSYRAIVQELDVMPGEFDGAAVRRKAIWLQKGTVTLPRPGYTMDIDGDLWTVESIDPTGLVDVITFALYQ